MLIVEYYCTDWDICVSIGYTDDWWDAWWDVYSVVTLLITEMIVEIVTVDCWDSWLMVDWCWEVYCDSFSTSILMMMFVMFQHHYDGNADDDLAL